ncbi:HAMP domain-containing protein [Actinocorallia herbida]|uniref:Signal transduction histidine-protein kinase/phosphatase MprB n=1 Tax=Actinocorallia herbida TaxID=58109 RepID=A0A3N1D2M3_9ACTN|nr:DUF4153 domain-containing protein [Actinocorallia herbida]ROO87784.1 HAMP domain-containing protein [Actinocorallia herbida]
MSWPRPLDPLRSIKIKFGVIAMFTALTSALLVKWGYYIGFKGRITLPVAVLGSMAVTQLIAHGMTAPLREMTAAARSMASGRYDRRVRVTSNDEVGELGEAFNTMAADLAEVDRQRREFVANVSHELRTPITALRAVLENVADGVTPATPAVLEGAVGQTERLGRLVTQLLDLSRVDAGAVPLELTHFDVRDFLAEVCASAPVVLVVQAGLTAHADRDRLFQVVANLVDNACRHSPPDGAVTVRASIVLTELVLEVIDEGPGIPESERPWVFERFVRGGSSDGGTGLGLAIARWAVDLHHGTIAVLDTETGCHIGVTIPLHHRRTAMPADWTAPAPQPSAPGPHPGDFAPALTQFMNDTDERVARAWPAPSGPATLRVLLPAGAAGIAGATFLNGKPGIGAALTTVAMVLALLPVLRGRLTLRNRTGLVFATLGLGLVLMPVLRDAPWLLVLTTALALPLLSYALVGGRSWFEVIGGGLTLPGALVSMLPWSSRGIASAAKAGRGTGTAAFRTAGLAGLLLLVFGALLTSADAAFSEMISALLPDLGLGSILARTFWFLIITSLVLAFAYLTITPPRLKELAPAPGTPAGRWAWAVPLLSLNLLFLAFCAVQARVLLDHAALPAGVSYSSYARQGFFQLVVVTVLVLAVIAIAVRHRPVSSAALIRLLLGALCVLTLVVVAVALRRLYLYEESSGWTRLRLWVHAFELWLGLVIVMITVAGIRMKANWLPRAVAATGAAGLLLLGLINPDGFIASRNVDRLARAERVVVPYLNGLSADAVPALDRLPEPRRSCVLQEIARDLEKPDGWTSKNLSRERARRILAERPVLPCR